MNRNLTPQECFESVRDAIISAEGAAAMRGDDEVDATRKQVVAVIIAIDSVLPELPDPLRIATVRLLFGRDDRFVTTDQMSLVGASALLDRIAGGSALGKGHIIPESTRLAIQYAFGLAAITDTLEEA